MPNGVDVEAPFHQPHAAQPWSLVFTGNMSYHPNEDAIRFFCRKILPLIQKRLPQVGLDVLGKNPSPNFLQFAKGICNVSVTGFVKNLKAEMLKRCVYVSPLRIGTGVKVKLLEAMSVGMPIIATAVSTEGLDVENGKHLLIASSPDEFAEKVVSAVSSLELRSHLGIQARMKMEQKYTWKKIGHELYSIYDKVASDHPPFS
ncbi:MAG: glycosyltransferase family 4 protein [Nitrososphaerales archaeon]